MAPNAGDLVWNDIIENELEKPTKTKAGYDMLRNIEVDRGQSC